MHQRRRATLRMPAALCAAATLSAVSATAAQAAVTQSVYTVTEITQTSNVEAGFGTYSWSNGATLRYTAAPGSNLVRFDFPTDASFDPFFRGGANPRYGVLQTKARSITQTGAVVQNGVSCAFAPAAPPDERKFRVRFYRTSKTAKNVLVEVMDQDAAVRVDTESRSGRMRAAGCGSMPSLGSQSPARSLGDDYRTSFSVPRATFRTATGRRPVVLVLKGTKRSQVSSNPGVVGTLTVTTTVKLRLVRAR